MVSQAQFFLQTLEAQTPRLVPSLAVGNPHLVTVYTLKMYKRKTLGSRHLTTYLVLVVHLL